MPYKTILYFRLSYFHVSNSALLSTSYFSTLILYRRSLDTFYYYSDHKNSVGEIDTSVFFSMMKPSNIFPLSAAPVSGFGPVLTHWGRDKMAAIFKWIFLNENVWISINISLKFVPRGPINNIPTLVQVMAWRRPGIIWTNDG